MKKLLILALIVSSIRLSAQSDLVWTKDSPAGMVELQINSAGSLLQGFMYKANGSKPHPTLLLLHGYPGNERNLDLAQAVRAHGWNVIYFNYRGSWGSQGEFSFRHCVEDVRNLITWCGQNAARLQIDMNNIALFGHSMGGFVCLKALAENPGIKKGFALSAWNLYADASNKSKNGKLNELEKEAEGEAQFESLPRAALQARNYANWNKSFVNWLFQTKQLNVFRSPARAMGNLPRERAKAWDNSTNQASSCA